MSLKKRNKNKVPDRFVQAHRASAVPDKSNDTKVELKLSDNASIIISIGNCQDQGARNYQEDSFGYSNITDSSIVTQKGVLAILSDGMGGLSNGKAVSDYVVQTSISVADSINPEMDIETQFRSIVLGINRQICDEYIENGVSTAGATLVLAYIYKNHIYWAAAGDSRLLCIRNGSLFQMNEDHDYKNTLYREHLEGKSGKEEAETNPQKDSLVSFIGKDDMSLIDISVRGYKIRNNDVFVLCSDGIYNGITEDAIKSIIKENDAQTASELIVKTVRDARFPGQDNMTVMVIKCSKK